MATAELPEQLKTDMALFTGCISGASSITNIESMLKDAGFEDITIKPKDESRDFLQNWMPDSKIEDCVVSATIEAIKPKA